MGKKKRRLFRFNKSKFTTILVIGCIIAVVGYDFVSRSKRESIQYVPEEYTRGNPKAKVTIIEFVDIQCPECARGTAIVNQYMKRYPRDIYLAVRLSPLEESNSLISAKYAECAARQDRFWIFIEQAFKTQSLWRTTANPRPYLNKLAKHANLSLRELSNCVDSPQTHQTVLGAKAYAEARFVKSTPTYYINKEIVVGVESLEKTMKFHFNEL